MKKRIFSLALVLALALSFAVPAGASSEEGGLRIIAPANWELGVGQSRTLDYVFPAEVEQRMLEWESSNEDVAVVDEWGRVTGVSPGEAEITATQTDGTLSGSVTVTVAATPTQGGFGPRVVDYAGTPVAEVENLQKIVTRYSKDEALASDAVPAEVKSALGSGGAVSDAVGFEQNGVKWEITDYGVLRTDPDPATERDAEMRFMGDRYFYEQDTTAGKVLAIYPDGENGAWTVMATGVTHIEMVEMSAAEKASIMSNTTQQYVSRRGMVAEAFWNGSEWVPRETDNDGLWTSMYAAGELMRYASLKEALAANPRSTELQEMVAEARETAYLSTEAVLLLANISMRTGDVEAYVRYIGDSGYKLYGGVPVYNEDGKGISEVALVEGGDYSLTTPDKSPAEVFEIGSVEPVDEDAWKDPREDDSVKYAKQTRSLGGFIARTYSLKGEAGGNADTYDGQIYWDLGEYSETNKYAVGKSKSEGVVNGEDLKGVKVDASGEIPQRLWNDLLGAGVEITDIVYKGDTSTDEMIGHLFLYKLAYDILGHEDAEIRQIIADTTQNFAQHLSDNEYMLVDGTGQPTTWGKLNRDYFYTYRWGAPSSPLTASVLLTAFKVAAYCTGQQKWEDEYRLLLTEGAYLYGDIMNTHSKRDREFLDKYAAPMLGGALGGNTLSQALEGYGLNAEMGFLLRMFAQYSDEEMAMLAFYTLFQLESDPETLEVYRGALDQWWNESIKYSENPLWYYIYQLSRPGETVTDAYGNNILETAAWSLSRHPIDTRRWTASNDARDDIVLIDLQNYGLDTRGGLTYDRKAYERGTKLPEFGAPTVVITGIMTGNITTGTWNLVPVVPAPDERAMHKYNNSSYILNDDNPNQMEGSTTYTLPYWMGVYHGMLALSEFEYVEEPYQPPVVVDPEPEPEPEPGTQLYYDVSPESWYHDAVEFVSTEGLFEGVGGGRFDPDGRTTRAMMVTVLWRLDGEKAVSGGTPFTDVAAGDWFAGAVSWAYDGGVVNGVSDTEFAPHSAITREQLVTILWRYAGAMGYDTGSGEAELAGYADSAEVSAYAREAMAWAVREGIVQGRPGMQLDPQDLVTRAEAAAIFQRFAALEK